jgi:hypothetical protein
MNQATRAHLYRSASDPSNLVVTVAAADLLELLREPPLGASVESLARSLDAMCEMPLEGDNCDPLIEVIHGLGHQSAALLRYQEARIMQLQAAFGLDVPMPIYNPADLPYITTPEPEDQER